MKKRFVVECVWHGYQASQSHICHRSVEPKYFADALRNVYAVAFSDGTTMSVNVRECTHRERVVQKHGYTSLLRSIVAKGMQGCVSIMDLK